MSSVAAPACSFGRTGAGSSFTSKGHRSRSLKGRLARSVTALTQTGQIPPNSVRLRALQVVVSKVEAPASGAAFEGTVAGAIAKGLSEAGGALIATRPRQTGDDASAKWVRHRREDDRKHRRRRFCRNGGYGSPRDNNVDLAADNSAAISARRSSCPFDQGYSIAMVLPSSQPSRHS